MLKMVARNFLESRDKVSSWYARSCYYLSKMETKCCSTKYAHSYNNGIMIMMLVKKNLGKFNLNKANRRIFLALHTLNKKYSVVYKFEWADQIKFRVNYTKVPLLLLYSQFCLFSMISL